MKEIKSILGVINTSIDALSRIIAAEQKITTLKNEMEETSRHKRDVKKKSESNK